MCGRFVVFDDKDIQEINKIIEDINKKYSGTGLMAKTGEIFPKDIVPVLALSEGKPSLSLMRWGFPLWNKKSVIINARSESAAYKETFAKPLAERRCVIPSTGFYEWRRGSNGEATKEKFLFNVENDQMLYMAAVYTDIPDDDIPLRERFVILTRQANDTMREIHNRMPVILYKNELTQWLSNPDFIPAVFKRDNVRLIKEAA